MLGSARERQYGDFEAVRMLMFEYVKFVTGAIEAGAGLMFAHAAVVFSMSMF